MTTRAVYIDLLSRLDTDSFLLALRRFIARRGKPFEILCDQGTNFKGAEKELHQTYAELVPELQKQLACQQIMFRFNPPHAPHFGGCWRGKFALLNKLYRSLWELNRYQRKLFTLCLLRLKES
ncbi:hypothetical protein QQF64_026187 [Cirrhinus molitorella]|uniref:Integrase catalytic domain-containing protein n=1 Tax=Cirrhinus molitorella TaxID=172907 RepID=A0ABR3NRG6_9TELE